MPKENLKLNASAQPGCQLYLTKPLGIGTLSTAQKKGELRPEDARRSLETMTTLNKLGEEFGKLPGIKAMTDVTGFGLLGHLSEICESSRVSAEIDFDKVPVIPSLPYYLDKGCIPGGTGRNWESYGHKIGNITERQKEILADPQTNGGLLVAVEENFIAQFEAAMTKRNHPLTSFGQLIPPQDDMLIKVR